MEGCPGVLATRAAMRGHFVHRHVHNTVFILEEGNLPLPQCPQCDLRVSRRALNGHHLGTSQSRTGTEWKRRRLAEAEMRVTSEKAFHAYLGTYEGATRRSSDLAYVYGSLPHVTRAFCRFLATAGQSLYVAVSSLPRYLNSCTEFIPTLLINPCQYIFFD